MAFHKAVFLRNERRDGKPVPEINILFIQDFIEGLLGTPVQVEVVLLQFRIVR